MDRKHMDSMTGAYMKHAGESQVGQSGFTLLETMIAIIILGGGLLALASAFAQGMVTMSTSHRHHVAKEKASEAIESVFTSRDTRTITWAQIRNVGGGGVFLNGAQALRTQGADGLVNTADDGAMETETQPGPDGLLGTGDDVVNPLNDYTREIQITDLAANLRQIRVIVRYRIGHLVRQYQLTTFISSFA
jgi:prepilin-type N-terminal cleavage/methylation domain-containing protein